MDDCETQRLARGDSPPRHESPGASDSLLDHLRAANRVRLHNAFGQATIHGLKGPLNAVTLSLDLLSRSLEEDDPLDPAARRLQVDCVERIRKGLSEVGDSLAPAVTVTGLAPARAETFDVSQLLHSILQAVRHDALVRNLSIDSALSRETILVSADREGLRQAILNLVLNAFEATPKGGRVRIALETEGERVRVRVEDDGSGILPEVLPHLFEEPFGRKGASGIGLFVTHRILELHEGTIRVENRVGGGAVAEIEFPTNTPGADDADRPTG